MTGYREFIWPETRLVIHESELREFYFDRKADKIGWLPRRPVKHVPWDGVERHETRFWRRCPTVQLGDWWMEEIGGEKRDGEVIAVDDISCQWLWEYALPGGTSVIVRYGWRKGELRRRVVPLDQVPPLWRALISEDWFLGHAQHKAR